MKTISKVVSVTLCAAAIVMLTGMYSAIGMFPFFVFGGLFKKKQEKTKFSDIAAQHTAQHPVPQPAAQPAPESFKPAEPKEAVPEERLTPPQPFEEMEELKPVDEPDLMDEDELEELDDAPQPLKLDNEDAFFFEDDEEEDDVPAPEAPAPEPFTPAPPPVEDLLEDELEDEFEELPPEEPDYAPEPEEEVEEVDEFRIDLPPAIPEEAIKLSEQIAEKMDAIDASLKDTLKATEGVEDYSRTSIIDERIRERLEEGEHWWDDWKGDLEELLE